MAGIDQCVFNTYRKSSYSVEDILREVFSAMQANPKPAILAQRWQGEYSISEAKTAFYRLTSTHHWNVPAHFGDNARV
jgi:hypothetical protein